ncbi:MAG: hypothetical protein V1865_03010 [bacterium]
MDQKKTIKNRALYLGTAIMALVITTAIVAGVSSARGLDNGFGLRDGNEPNYSPERHIAMQTAFENNDYDAWKELMTQQQNEMAQAHQKMIEAITEENFAQFAEMHQLMMDGDYEGAKAISDELGLPGWQGKGFRKMGRGQGCHHLE